MNVGIQKLMAIFMTIINFLLSLFGLPTYPKGVDVMTKRLPTEFVMTLNEDFDGAELDRGLWSGHYTYGNTSSVRRGGFWNNNLPFTRDGNLVIPCKYIEEGMGGKGAGWYTAGIDTAGRFEQRYGYFECRCILPKGAQLWAAFWMMNDGVYEVDGNGRDGTEIDVFESPFYGDKRSNQVSSNLHYDGYADGHKHSGQKFLVKGNPYEEYNTYGVEWNENGYTFYINGQITLQTDFGGVSRNPEYLILSVEFADQLTPRIPVIEGDCAEFIVDYVRAYQYKELAQ